MMVASWYGMNFHDMPELDAAYAYPVLTGITLGLCVLLYILLKKAHALVG